MSRNEYFTIYDDEKESLKVNLEDLKRYREQQAEKQSKRLAKKQSARQAALRQGLKLGRWQGTFAKIKDQNGYFHLNSCTVVDRRPGPQPKNA